MAPGAGPAARPRVTYVLPLRWDEDGGIVELSSYVERLATWVDEVIVVDGSPPHRFAEHRRRLPPAATHVPADGDLQLRNGKVNGVVTGVRRAAHDAVVIADDDVRYDRQSLACVVDALREADAVRPQNFFDPLPWHARWDTARTLIARATGGDFPGTLAVRRSVLERTGGYDGDVLFENLELLRTVEAAGGMVRSCPGCYVRRRPPDARRFWSQRVRQAYDELARPGRLAVTLAVLPAVVTLAARRRVRSLAASAAATVLVAEAGRRRAGGRAVFPASGSFLAPVWVLERATCAWVAVLLWASRRGCPYAGHRFLRAATPTRRLRRQVLERSPGPVERRPFDRTRGGAGASTG